MNRLTKKNNGTGSWTQFGDKYLPAHNIKHKQCVNKLGQLEDIEEENGLDLITLFKILKQRFVYDKNQVKIELLGLHIKSDELCLYGFVEDTMHAVYLRLKDYGKTWTMTKEEFYKNIK